MSSKHLYSLFSIRTLLIVFLVGISAISRGQKTNLDLIYELNKYELDKSQIQLLNNYIESVDQNQLSQININGHTDEVGLAAYNLELSRKRAETVANYLEKNGISKGIIQVSYFGETQPLKNTTALDKNNRRVELELIRKNNSTISTKSETITSNWLLDSIQPKGQEFCIDNNRDTIIYGKKGTIIHFKAYSLMHKNGDTIKECVELKLSEAYNKVDMLLYNLTTMSDGNLLETDGMFKLDIKDSDKYELVKDYTVLIPTDSLRYDAQVFDGDYDSHSGLVNWELNNSTLQFIGNQGLYKCLEEYIYYPILNRIKEEKCPLFFCKIKRIFRKEKNTPRNTTSTFVEEINSCNALDSLMQLYNISNKNALKDAMLQEEFKKYNVSNIEDYREIKKKELFEKYNVTSERELQAAIQLERQQDIEKKLMSTDPLDQKNLAFNLNYYMASFTGVGWKNIDVFSKLNYLKKVNFIINETPSPNISIRLVFTDYDVIAPIYSFKENYYQALNFPENLKAWIIAFKAEPDGLYLAKKEIIISKEEINLEFFKTTTKDLKKELEFLNAK